MLWNTNENKGVIKMQITLIRHGKTEGNAKKLFVGVTDHVILEEGKNQLIEYKNMNLYPCPDDIYVSPLKRCISTCEIIYPNKSYVIENGLREINFGKFEAMSYEEVASIPEYEEYLNDENKISFPDGDNIGEFKERCISTFESIIKKGKNSALICHGGTIMAIMEKYGLPKGGFYNWYVENGLGYILEFENNIVKSVEKIQV